MFVVVVGEVDTDDYQTSHAPSQKRDEDPNDVVSDDDGDAVSDGFVDSSEVHRFSFQGKHWKVFALPMR